MFIRVTFYCSNIKEAHKKHAETNGLHLLSCCCCCLHCCYSVVAPLIPFVEFVAAAAAPTAVFGWANEALTQDAFIAMVIFKIVMSLQRARLWCGKAIKFRWWFFLSFICYLDLDLALAICSLCVCCVRISLFNVCIWLHFVQLVMVHDLSSANIKSVTFLYIFMAFYSFKNSMNSFALVLLKPINCAQWYGGFILDLAWIPHCGFYSISGNSSRWWNSSHCL